MKKQITILLVLLFSIILVDQAGNNIPAGAITNSTFAPAEADSIDQNVPTLKP
jgi:hypothetical protein